MLIGFPCRGLIQMGNEAPRDRSWDYQTRRISEAWISQTVRVDEQFMKFWKESVQEEEKWTQYEETTNEIIDFGIEKTYERIGRE